MQICTTLSLIRQHHFHRFIPPMTSFFPLICPTYQLPPKRNSSLLTYETKQYVQCFLEEMEKCMATTTAAMAAKLHIEEIRTQKFSIGKKEPNPLTQDLHHAVTSLSAELYTKDVHFLMEIIQNAEDNEYQAGVEPTLEFVLTKDDITGSGAPATLLIWNEVRNG